MRGDAAALTGPLHASPGYPQGAPLPYTGRWLASCMVGVPLAGTLGSGVGGIAAQYMHRFFIPPELLKETNTSISLPKELAHQVRDVLRLTTGEQLLLL